MSTATPTKTVTIGTIGRLDVGETFGFQTARTLNEGDEFPVKTQVPKKSQPYGTARVKEVRFLKPYNWVLAERVS